MDSEIRSVEDRLKSFLGQLQTEYGILDRLVYKGKNQHRHCIYFQYLLKVRRDLRLLEAAHLDEILSSCFQVINGNKPKKVHFLESLKRKKSNSGKYNFLERLLGVARLLTQMVEQMLKAAIEISTLLARSFFMGFSLTVLALLARLRVLIQQILLDVVSVFNIVSSISREKHCVKLLEEGMEVFREYYPLKEDFITLECVWETDKFMVHEKMTKSDTQTNNGKFKANSSLDPSAIQYQSLEAFLGGDETGSVNSNPNRTEGLIHGKEDDETNPSMFRSTDSDDEKQQIEGFGKVEDSSGIAVSSIKTSVSIESASISSSSSYPLSSPLKRKSETNHRVAFVSVKRHTPPIVNKQQSGIEEIRGDGDGKEDPFFSLLTGGNLKDCSLF